MEPVDESGLIAYLEEYGSRWKDHCDFIKVYAHPTYTALRLVKGERDIGISFDYDLSVWISAGSPAPEETNEEWLSNPGGYKRPSYSIQAFAEERFPNQSKWMIRNTHRLVNRGRLDQVKRFFAINHEVIDLFVKDQLQK